MRSTLSFFFFLFVIQVSFSRQVQGIVLDINDQPIVGATITSKGTVFQGTITNSKGEFKFEISNDTEELIISFLGYESKTIHVDSFRTSNFKTVVLNEKLYDLDIIVVKAMTLTGGNAQQANLIGTGKYITPQELESLEYKDVNRIIQSVPGVNIQEEDGFGLRPNIGLRGTTTERSSKITLMEDGVLMAPAPYSAPSAYYFPNMNKMHSMEILKGSSQIQYGPHTTGGAINMLTTPIPEKFSGRLETSFGNFSTRNIGGWIGNSHENIGYVVHGNYHFSDGFKELPNNTNTGYDIKDIVGKFRINTDKNFKTKQFFEFKAGYTHERSNETYLGLTVDDFEEDPYQRYAASQVDQMLSEHKQFSLTHYIKPSNKIHLYSTVYRNTFERNWYKLDKVQVGTSGKQGISNVLNNLSDHQNEYAALLGMADSANYFVKANNRAYVSQGIQSTLTLDFDKEKIENHLEIGMRFHFDEMDRFQWNDVFEMNDGEMLILEQGLPGTESNRIHRANAFAGHIQYEFISDKWRVVPGLRYENISLSKEDYGKNDIERLGTDLKEQSNKISIFVPGIGVNFNPWKKLYLFTGVHQGFSPPGTNPESDPEKSINFELGGRLFHKGLFIESAFFLSDYSNLLGNDLAAGGGTGSANLYNAGEAKAHGVEFALNYDLLQRVKTDFSVPFAVTYTYTSAKFSSDFESEGSWGEIMKGEYIPYIAPHQLAIKTGFKYKGFELTLNGFTKSKMAVEPLMNISDNSELTTDSYFILDVAAKYTVNKYISFFLQGDNITKNKYRVAIHPAGWRPGKPNTFLGGFRIGF